MNKRDIIWGSICSAVLIFGCLLHAQDDAVDPGRFPKLAAAQNLCWQAIDQISASQQVVHHQEGGHAERAKDLLRQASHEIKLASLAAMQAGH